MSKIILGTWGLSGDYGNVSLETIQEVLEYGYLAGIMEYDTAPSYGNGFAEFCLGVVFKDKDVLINTKIGNVPFLGKCFELESLKESFRQSMIRLKRDSVHALFLHNPRSLDNYDELLSWMNSLKKENKIKYTGICLARGWDYSKETDIKSFDIIQDDANLLERAFETGDYRPCVFYARSPLASGILSGSLSQSSVFEKEDHRSQWLRGERLAEVLGQINALNIKNNLASEARKFVLTHKKIDKVIFGIKNIKQLKDLLG